VSVDPFQHLDKNDAFATPNNEPVSEQRWVKSVPIVVTVERVPDFSLKRSSSMKDGQTVSSRSEPGKVYEDRDDREQRYRGRDSRDQALHNIESIEETEHSNAAIAAEGYRQ